MTFNANETGRHSGLPLEVYRFTYGTNEYLYTTADEAVTVDIGGVPMLFNPVQGLRRSSPDYSREPSSGTMTVFMPRTDPLAVIVASIPTSPVGITVYRRHETDADSDYVVVYPGRVIAASLEGAEAQLACQRLDAATRRKIPRINTQRLCNWATYGPGCNLNRASFKDTVVVTGVAGSLVRFTPSPSRPDGWYEAGYLETADAARRHIRSHTGEYLTLAAPLEGLIAGATVSLYAGDDHTEETCRNKFSNVARFNGDPRIPVRNPFETGSAS